MVFSAGGMFGAWQAGAWRALAPRFQPDLVVGASVGCLNGLAVSAGLSAEELEDYWLTCPATRKLRFRLPQHPLQGVFDPHDLERTIRDVYARWRPKLDFAVVLTDTLRMKPCVFRGAEITAEHLLASCAVPGCFDQRRIRGRLYTDGGLLNGLPLWAAFELGASHVVGLDCMPLIFRRRPRPVPPNALRIAPRQRLGPLRQMLAWREDRIRTWIAMGHRDGLAACEEKNISLGNVFERQ